MGPLGERRRPAWRAGRGGRAAPVRRAGDPGPLHSRIRQGGICVPGRFCRLPRWRRTRAGDQATLPLHLPLPGTAGWPWGTPSPSSRQQRRCDTAETSPWVPVLLGTQPRFHPAAWGAGGGGVPASSGRPQPPPSARLAPRARGHCRFRLPSFLRSLFWLR